MKIQVTTLYHDNDTHGTELSVHATEDDARDDAYRTAVSSWDNLDCFDGQHCGVSGCQGVLADPSRLSRDEATSVYFSHRSSESADIVSHDLDVPLTALFGDWVRRAQHEVDLSYTEPRDSSVFRTLIEELLARDTPHAA